MGKVPEKKLRGQNRRIGLATLEVCNHNAQSPSCERGVCLGQTSLQQADLVQETGFFYQEKNMLVIAL